MCIGKKNQNNKRSIHGFILYLKTRCFFNLYECSGTNSKRFPLLYAMPRRHSRGSGVYVESPKLTGVSFRHVKLLECPRSKNLGGPPAPPRGTGHDRARGAGGETAVAARGAWVVSATGCFLARPLATLAGEAGRWGPRPLLLAARPLPS